MENRFKQMSASQRWTILVDAVLVTAAKEGMSIKRKPGRGKSNVWAWDHDGTEDLIAIRTSQDRAFAFPPLEKGKKWKTLDDVQHVMVAAVDNAENPQAVEVYFFSQKEVRARFDLNYKTRINDGQTIPDNFGNWIAMDEDDRGIAQCAGSGIAQAFPAIATFQLADLMNKVEVAKELASENTDASDAKEPPAARTAPLTVGDTISWARTHIADLAGVPLEAVKLELKIEYA